MRLIVRGIALGAVISVAALLVPSSISQDQLQVGYTTLAPDPGSVAPVGSAIFSFTNSNGVLVSETGVGAATPTRSGRIFVDQVGSATAIALVNTSTASANATLTLRNANGNSIGTPQARTIKAGEHVSAYVSELFGQAATGIRGSLTFESDQALSAIAIRETRNQYGDPIYATLPVSDLLASANTTPLSFPHIAAGAGFTTHLVLVNTTAGTLNGHVKFASDAGTPLSLMVNGALTSDISYSLPSHGTYLAEVAGGNTLDTGAALVTPNLGQATPAGTAIFRYSPNGTFMTEAAAYATATTHSRMVVDYIGTQTGVAIANPGSATASVTFTLMDRFGNASEITSRTLAPGGHLSLLVHEMFPDVADPFSGLLDIASTVPVAPVTLKLTYNLRSDLLMTTLPIADLTAAPSSVPLIFPHIILGSGWGTQLVLVNPVATQTASGKITFIDSLGSPIVTNMGGQTGSRFSYQIAGGSGRRFIPGNAAAFVSAFALDPATNRTTSEITVNTGNTVPLPLLVYDSRGKVRDDFDATVISSNTAVAAATAAGVVGRQAGFSTLAIGVGGTAATVTATVVDVQSGPAGFQPVGIAQDLAQRVYLSAPNDSTILIAPDLRSTPTTYAGISRSPGLTNDVRLKSQFRTPVYMVLNQADGSLFVADSGNNLIRRIRPGSSGRVETFAGNGSAGSQDGPLLQASFNNPQGLALDGRGGLWVVDSGNHTIRRIRLATGVVETIAGKAGTLGFADGTGDVARFNSPIGIAVEPETVVQQLARQQSGAPAPSISLIVADTGNGRLRRVKESGEVSTLAVSGNAIATSPSTKDPSGKTFAAATAGSVPVVSESPTGVGVDPSGNVYFTESRTGLLKLILNNGSLVSGAQRNTFTSPRGLAIAANGKVAVADAAQSAQQIVFGEPSITGLSRTRVPSTGGQALVIQGHNFSPESIVIVGGVVVTGARVESTERISLTAPALPSGITTITVQNRAGLGQSSLLVDPIPLSTLPAGYVTTVAGGTTFIGDGGKATSAVFVSPWRMAQDGLGNFYISDSGARRIRKISALSGIITTVAGTGQVGFSGDEQPATAAMLDSPAGVAVDRAGNIFIADYNNNRIRKVSAQTGVITTIAGGGSALEDGVAATSSFLGGPYGIAIDNSGNVIFGDLHHYKVRKIDATTGLISTVAGTGTRGFSGDGGPATAAKLTDPYALALAPNGDLFISELNGSYKVRKVSASTGTISTVLGTGIRGSSQTSGPGTSFLIDDASDISVDEAGNLFAVDYLNSRVLKLDAITQLVTILPGTGTRSVAVSTEGSVFHLTFNSLLRIDNTTGETTLLGGGVNLLTDEGGPATAARFFGPGGLAVDGANNLYISDSSNYRIAKVTSTTGLLTRVGIISSPHALTTDPSGTLYAQSGSLQFYKITPNGDTTFYAGGDAVFPGGFSGDGGPAINAVFNTPTALCRDASGNIFIADTGNNRIRKINGTTGIITTVAGNGQSGNTGDNGPAVNAKLSFPHGVATDKSGNLFILGDTSVRKVAADTGTITTVANISTDRGTIIVDASGNIFIADAYRIRRISASTGTVTTIAGGTQFGDSGDGGPAISALFNFGYSDLFPGLAFDSAGNLYISDTWNGRIRVIKAPIP